MDHEVRDRGERDDKKKENRADGFGYAERKLASFLLPVPPSFTTFAPLSIRLGLKAHRTIKEDHNINEGEAKAQNDSASAICPALQSFGGVDRCCCLCGSK
jgi:hypothetical protein